jgi:hypothetical protein
MVPNHQPDLDNNGSFQYFHVLAEMFTQVWIWIPSGKHTKNYGKSPFLMGKSTISMGHFQELTLYVYRAG